MNHAAFGRVWRVLITLIVILSFTEAAEVPKSGEYNTSKGEQDFATLKLTKAERDYLKAHPVLKVQSESNWPPFNFTENGVPKGFSVDYIRLLAQKIGVEVEFVGDYTWEEFMKMIRTDKLDLIINIAPTEERSKFLVFTRPYIWVRNAIYTNINNQVYYSLEDLKGKQVALPKDFFIQRYLARHYPEIKQVHVADQLEALELLSFGKVDAVIGKQVVVDYLLRKHLLSNVIATSYVKDPGTLSHIAIGAAKKDEILIRILDKAQESVDPKVVERLKHKWFGINALLDTTKLLTPEEQRELRKKRTLDICYRPDYAPIEFERDGKPQGIAIDVVNILAKRLGLKVRYVAAPSWEQTENLLRDHRCDLLPAALQTRRNITLLLFTRPYLSYETVIVAPKQIGEVKDLDALQGKIMAARWDDPLIERLKRSHPWLKIREFGTYAEVFDALKNGEAEFAVAPKVIFDYYANLHQRGSLHVAGRLPIKSDISIAVRKDELLLFDALNKILEALPVESFQAINEKWTKETIVRHLDYWLLFKYLGAAALIILLMLIAYLRQRKLSRKIEEFNTLLEKRIEEALEENRQQQLLMLHRDRLANMGEMIAMIAHQWRQPLNNLSLLNQLLVTKYRKGKLDDAMIEYFSDHSRKQIEQMSRTIDDFRNFYKPDKEKREFCIEETIRQLIDLVSISYASEKITIVYEGDECNRFVGYANELAHAVLNIMNNARDALIERHFGKKEIRIEVHREGEEVVITVCDTAGGIPEEIMPRIFDPYFSTKSEKNGTGLGLYMTNVIITEHLNSKISVENREEGACFTIRLQQSPDHELPA